MSYEDAPSTVLLATHCAVCGRALRDAPSVEAGIGPDCADRVGMPHGFGGDREEANALIHKIAALRCEGPEIAPAIDRLRALGFPRAASILVERVAAIAARAKIEIVDAGLVFEVSTPKPDEVQLAAFRAIPGRRYDRERRLNIIPKSARRELFTALAKAFPGELAAGPRGPFTLPNAS